MPEGKEQPVREALLHEYGRTVAIFAAAGLVLSLVAGLFARNPFGTMLLRAVLLAIAFGGVGAGMQYVARRFLIGDAAGGPAGPADADAAEAPTGSTIDIVLPEEPVPAEAGPEAGGEPLEELPSTGDGAGDAAVEELESAETPKAPEATAPVTGDLDALPEFGRAEPTGTAARGAARVPGSRARPSDATREVLERHDPAALARGLRTMLKRDERS